MFNFLWRKRGILTVWVFGLGFFFGGIMLVWVATLTVPDLSSLQTRKIEQSVQIYDRTGEVLLYDLNRDIQRTIVPLSQISPNIQHAVIAIEDPEFYTHHGFKPTAFLRALLVNATTLDFSQGGSTITQQVVKNSILTGTKSIARKIEEIVLALKLERVYDKDQILELYLNGIPYGGSVYGAEQASQQFFGKRASDVTVPEAAYLAAVMPAPTYFSPWGNHRDKLDARKNLVLEKMREHGFITQAEYEDAVAAQVVFKDRRDTAIAAPHFVFYVEQYLEEQYGKESLLSGGYKVITTLDADLQVKAQETVQEKALKNVGDFNATNMALVAIDPATGQILSMVGSRNYFDTEIPGAFNVALAHRQPGSTFKPFAYAEAFLKGYTPETIVFDVPTQFSTTCGPSNLSNEGGCYAPKDYDGKWRGPMTMRNALAQSINIPAVKTLYMAGLGNTMALARSMGVALAGDQGQYGLTLVLGGGEVTLLDMTSAYGAFAQNGVRHAPTAILRIEDTQGNVLFDGTEGTPGTQVLPREIAEQINDVLSDAQARQPLGINAYSAIPGRDVAVKTGTTNDYRDAWIVGYAPNLVIGVWAGNNDNTPMERRVGGLIVAPAWHEVMSYGLSHMPQAYFSRTEQNTTSLKPVLRGIWQGSDVVADPQTGGSAVVCNTHSLLYWVDKNNPRGSAPKETSTDSQFSLWEYSVLNWAAANGCPSGSIVPITGNTAGAAYPPESSAAPTGAQPVFVGGAIIPH